MDEAAKHEFERRCEIEAMSNESDAQFGLHYKNLLMKHQVRVSERESIVSAQGFVNDKFCSLCATKLPLLFKRGFECEQCHYYSCQQCKVTATDKDICAICIMQQKVDAMADEFKQICKQLPESSFGYQKILISVESSSDWVRRAQLEAIVRQALSPQADVPLDDANVMQTFNDGTFNEHLSALSSLFADDQMSLQRVYLSCRQSADDLKHLFMYNDVCSNATDDTPSTYARLLASAFLIKLRDSTERAVRAEGRNHSLALEPIEERASSTDGSVQNSTDLDVPATPGSSVVLMPQADHIPQTHHATEPSVELSNGSTSDLVTVSLPHSNMQPTCNGAVPVPVPDELVITKPHIDVCPSIMVRHRGIRAHSQLMARYRRKMVPARLPIIMQRIVQRPEAMPRRSLTANQTNGPTSSQPASPRVQPIPVPLDPPVDYDSVHETPNRTNEPLQLPSTAPEIDGRSDSSLPPTPTRGNVCDGSDHDSDIVQSAQQHLLSHKRVLPRMESVEVDIDSALGTDMDSSTLSSLSANWFLKQNGTPPPGGRRSQSSHRVPLSIQSLNKAVPNQNTPRSESVSSMDIDGDLSLDADGRQRTQSVSSAWQSSLSNHSSLPQHTDQALPRITMANAVLTCDEGDHVNMQCLLLAGEPLDVYWYDERGQVAEHGRHRTVHGQHSHSLEIFDTRPSDSGQYVVVAVNDLSVTKAVAQLTVNPLDLACDMPQLLKSLEDVVCAEKKELVLSCTVTSCPIARLAFFKGHTQLRDNDRYTTTWKIVASGVCEWELRVRKAVVSDSGQYAAVAVNRAGTCTTRCIVSVHPNRQHKHTRKQPIKYTEHFVYDV